MGKGGCMWDLAPADDGAGYAQAALLAREDPTSRTGMAARRRALLPALNTPAKPVSRFLLLHLTSSPARRRAARQSGTSGLRTQQLLARAASITLRAPQTGLMQAGIVQATTRTTWLCAAVDRPTPAWDPLH